MENASINTNVSVKKKNHTNFMFFLKRDWLLYLMLLIPLIFVIIFKYVPMLGLIIAFKDYDPVSGGFSGILQSKWIGIDVFKEIFKMKDFYKVVRNTLLLNVLDLVTGFPAPILLAIFLNELRMQKFKKISQTILYLPHFLSWVIISGIMYQLLSPNSGLVNLLIMQAGGQPIPFVSEKWHWLLTYNIVGIWQSAGWGTIIYLAAITGINTELYEAATVDGAGRIKKIWHITLPGIRSTIIVMLIMNLGKIMGISFERAFAMGNSMVMDFGDVIATFVYRVGLQSVRYNVATAVGLFQSVIGLLLVVLTDFIAKRSGEQGII
jgi:ABC-type polysaccharide transport system, permease component